MKKIVKDDLERIYNGLTDEERKRFSGSTVLLTGGAGFLGFYFIHFLTYYQEELAIEDIICLDNFLLRLNLSATWDSPFGNYPDI